MFAIMRSRRDYSLRFEQDSMSHRKRNKIFFEIAGEA